ncbi:probable RNA-binding protein ARP1 [Arabidopsis lyrata subsp. lyrata]|uniref:probable RNA-binding protein ARP1 n=1 Tax=Arabidopsis lyrata subsp. lyrata TaxID=81972 RepID=UPI000A29E35D|nr:probable RNA-binding protein ARP1 [Arabidopsis lyrata subsp. lyrata]|eukprot:XP_020888866.1 probable RNA-binding protein ARP1 [Arabidopsis lyrata subsp. lyrata]
MMSQTSENNNHDTASRKIFVGSLAWQTTTEDLRRFFEQFGEVIDANVVCETYPGRSKGYGFVTFKDAVSAARALENPRPVIDGRTTNCNLASLRVKQNMNQPHKNELLNQVRPPHQYQPGLQHLIPYCTRVIWDSVSGQYRYMYNNPCYPFPTQMVHYNYNYACITQPNSHQTNRKPVVISAPQKSSAPRHIINEIDQRAVPPKSSVRTERISQIKQELIVDDDNKEVVTKPDSDADQQRATGQAGDNIGKDGDIKQDAMNQEGKINGQEYGMKQAVYAAIDDIHKFFMNEVTCEQKHDTNQDEDVTKEVLDNGIKVTHQDEDVQVAEDTL